MSIVLRTVKGSALTYEQLDENLSQFYYSASLHNSGTRLRLHYTGSAGLSIQPGYDEVVFPLVTNTLQSVSSTGNTTNQGIIITANGLEVTGSLDVSGSTAMNGSLGVIGPTNLTGSFYLTNGTVNDDYYPLYNANFYRKSFIKNPSSFSIGNNHHTAFTGSSTTTSPLVGTLDFTDVSISGSSLSDIYGIYNRTRILDYTKINNLYGITSQIRISGSADSQANVINQAQGMQGFLSVEGNSPTTIDRLYGILGRTSVTNGNANITAGISSLSTTLTLTTGSAATVSNLDIINNVNSNFTISGDFYNIVADADVPTVGGTAYNIYMPAAMDSVLGGSITASSFVKNGATSDDVLLGDGTTTSLSGIGGSTDTGSLLTTASVNLNEITFTKGDSSTFIITVDTGSSYPAGTSLFETGSADPTIQTAYGTNTAGASYSVVLGGNANNSTGQYSSIVGGLTNVISEQKSGISAGELNTINSRFSFIGAGLQNTGSGAYSAIGGGIRNQTLDSGSFIGGGTTNIASGSYSSVLSGESNIARGQYSSILTGLSNSIQSDGISSVILGGRNNEIIASGSAIVAGANNDITANGKFSCILAGTQITADRSETAYAKNIYITGSTSAQSTDFTAVLQVARRETTPTLAEEGMIINSGSAGNSDLYFYKGSSGGWVKLTP